MTLLRAAVVALAMVSLMAAPNLCYSAEDAHADAAHGDAEASHGGAHGGNTDPIIVDIDLAIWTVVIFVVLMLVLGKFAWKPIAEGLDRREQAIADQFAAAENSKEEAKGLLREHQEIMAGAQDQVRAILDEARRDAEKTQEEMHEKARVESEAIVQRGRNEIDQATSSALKELAERSARQAVDLAGKIVEAELDSGKHAVLIDEAVNRFPRGTPSTN